MPAARLGTPARRTGAQPREDRSTVRNRGATNGWIGVPDLPFTDGEKRELSPVMDWPARTEKWWSVIRVMPHVRLWDESDWEFAEATAFIHAALWSGETNKAAELRIRERTMGVTEESRRALRIRYMPPDDEDNADVISLDQPIPFEERPPLKGQTKPRLRAVDPEFRK